MKVWNAYYMQHMNTSWVSRCVFSRISISSLDFKLVDAMVERTRKLKKKMYLRRTRIFGKYSWMYFEIYEVDCSQIISPSDVIYNLRTFDLLKQMIFGLYLPIEEACLWWTSKINDRRLVRFRLLQPLRWINHSTLIVIKNWL